jgi:hypothetical protein
MTQTPADTYRQQRAIQVLMQGIKYIMGYLPDYVFDIVPNLEGNPIELTIKIRWAESDLEPTKMPPIWRATLKKVEEQLLRVSQLERNP